MQITDVKIFLVDEEKLKAFVSIVLDSCFMVNDIKVIQGREGLFISMPSRRKRNGQFKDVAHPLNHETRAWLEDCVLTEYDRARIAQENEREPERDEEFEPSPELAAGIPGDATDPRHSPSLAASPSQDSGQEGERSLEEVQRRHSSDTYWSVG